MRYAIALLLLTVTAAAEVREVKPNLHLLPPIIPTPETIAERVENKARVAAMRERAIAMRELAGVSTNAMDSVAISNQVAQIRERGIILQGLAAVVADTRSNMVEVASLSDAEVAGLYIAQMRKAADELLTTAKTNTIEHIIGAGMRQDLRGE